MFKRDDSTYQFKEDTIPLILEDEANPIFQIVSIIPEGSRVLDIGAGNGILAKAFQAKNKKIFIDGVEPNEAACLLAGPNYQNLYHGYLDEFADKLDFTGYDYFVCADVMEHTADPYEFLQSIVSRMPAHAKLILSVPNIAFATIRYTLARGEFNYVDSGLLEKSHLRFFTCQTLLQLFRQQNLYIQEIIYLQRAFTKTEIPIKVTNLGDLFFLFLVSRDPLSHIYQFLFILSIEKVDTRSSHRGESQANLFKYALKKSLARLKR